MTIRLLRETAEDMQDFLSRLRAENNLVFEIQDVGAFALFILIRANRNSFKMKNSYRLALHSAYWMMNP